MRMLEAMALEHGVGLNDLWVWPIHRLRLALAWSDSLVDQVDRYRRACGASPDLDVPDDVILPADQAWPACLNDLPRPPWHFSSGPL